MNAISQAKIDVDASPWLTDFLNGQTADLLAASNPPRGHGRRARKPLGGTHPGAGVPGVINSAIRKPFRLVEEHGGVGKTIVLGDTELFALCDALDLPRRLYDETLSGSHGFWILVVPGVIHKQQPLFNEGSPMWHLDGATLPLANPLCIDAKRVGGQALQVVGIPRVGEAAESNPLQQNAGFSQSFAAHLLPGSEDESRNFLRVCDVAKRLGVSRSGVYALCARGELRHVRVMNCIRVAQSDLLDFLKSRRSGRPTVRPAEGR